MPLVTLRDLLHDAVQRDYTAVQFNADCLEVAQAVFRTAEEERAPVILGVGQGAARDGKIEALAAVVRDYAFRSKLPIVLHLDHSEEPRQIVQAVRAGFSSVMVDGSALPLADNIALTRQAIALCAPVGISVEAELGRIAGMEDDVTVAEDQANKVDVRTVEEFIAGIEVDALAVAIGSAHGVYKAEPKLDFDLLAELTKITSTPLVLHGGSGIPEASLRRSFALGMKKLNVGTEIRLGFMAGVTEGIAGGESIFSAFDRGRAEVAKFVRQKLAVSASAGKA
ncbi:class II fructose-bisphosphate aldolase [Labrys monachus]|uniref:Fructose-bisphosphate aldolase class II n=1 Tax=Labrys monachus TaxID=217067 RepID=A0ABU0FFE9_9HYPH|nr:class II fructose-bisphosphate aldolase [Labrys monachus]MDQ0393339.1 fructose-bisphosphate aldolase class II [Labrys monachus]